MNKAADSDWFTISADKGGTKVRGKKRERERETKKEEEEKKSLPRSLLSSFANRPPPFLPPFLLNTLFPFESTPKTKKQQRQWSGTCWYVHDLLRYEFPFEFETPATYPATAPEIRIPALDGKTAKMYRGGAICLTLHFKPLWGRNAPHFGVAHALCLGLAPWLAAEVRWIFIFFNREGDTARARGRRGRRKNSRRSLASLLQTTLLLKKNHLLSHAGPAPRRRGRRGAQGVEEEKESFQTKKKVVIL